GAVSLRGDTNVLILIDGKPATQLQGSKAGDNLQSVPASDIERIEILTTPPAQFKAAGAAGVINIITRKRRAKESASASLTGSLGDGGRWLVGGNGSYGGKQFTASLNAGFREDYRSRTIDSRVIGPDPTTGQTTTTRRCDSPRSSAGQGRCWTSPCTARSRISTSSMTTSTIHSCCRRPRFTTT